MTLPTEFDGLRLPAQARQLMTLVLQSGRPALTTTEGYVALRGAADHSIAAFVHADRVSIALDREDADRLGRIEGFRLERTNDTTWHAVLPWQLLTATNIEEATRACHRALERSLAGGLRAPRRPRAAAQQAQVPATCPVHHVALTPAGDCPMGSDH
jgi:hypothetical protein